MRPSSHTKAVGDLYSSTFGGRLPCQSGPVIANVRALPPPLRVPGEAKTLVQASIIGSRK